MTTVSMPNLPYEVINDIIKLVSQLNKSRWVLHTNPTTGKMRLQIYPDSQVFAPIRAIRNQMRDPVSVIYDGHALSGLKTIISTTTEIIRLFDDELGIFLGEKAMLRTTELIEIQSSRQFAYLTGRYDPDNLTPYTFLKGTIGRASSLYAPMEIDNVDVFDGEIQTFMIAPAFLGAWTWNDALQIMEFIIDVDVPDVDNDVEDDWVDAEFDEPFDEAVEFNLLEAFDAVADDVDVDAVAEDFDDEFIPFAM